jgi:hypothetical protein
MRWIRLWCDDLLFGSTFQELENTDEIAMWFLALIIAGHSPISGKLLISVHTPYPREAMADLLHIPIERVNIAIKKLIDAEKLTIKDGILEISKWHKYQTRYDKYYKADGINMHPEKDGINMPIEEDKKKKRKEEDKNNIIYSHFKKPAIKEIQQYCQDRNNDVDPQKFYDFYEAKGWMIGKNKMKDWKAAVRTWEKDKKVKFDGWSKHE